MVMDKVALIIASQAIDVNHNQSYSHPDRLSVTCNTHTPIICRLESYEGALIGAGELASAGALILNASAGR
jgi:hypothetical protein